MNAKFALLLRSAGLVACALLPFAASHAAEADALPAPEENYVKVSGQGASYNNNKAAAQARTQVPKVGIGGIEELNVTKELSKDTSLVIDGRALLGSEDYLGQFRLTKNEVGSFEAGYKRFRTFYDGAGGFFPLNNAWLPIYPRALFVDRGKFFVNATIAMPNAPVFTFRYTNETRGGRKASTIWGDTDFTGVPIYSLSSLNPVSANRKIIPAYIQLGERQEVWEASVKHTVGKTTGLFTISGNRINNLDTRSVDRYPGELKPFPAIPSSPAILVAPGLANNQNKGFDQQGFKEDGVTVAGKVETVISDKITAFIGGNYHHSTNDITASRLIAGSVATLTGTVAPIGAFTSGGRPPYSYNSTGALKMNVWTGNVGLETKPTTDLRVDFAVRAEELKNSGNNKAVYVNNLVNQTTGVVTQILVDAPNSVKNTEKPWTPAIDARYTGIKNVSLYGSWDYRSVTQDERTVYTGITPSGATILQSLGGASDKVKEKHANLKLGANWTASAQLNVRAEFFTKDHENRFDGYGASLGSYYVLDYDIYGARLTAIYKPMPQLSLNSRYVVQRGKASIMEDGYVEGDSNDSRRYQFAETIDWVPNKGFYLQGNVNVVFDKTSTSYPRTTGTAADVLHNADNNYWNGSVIAAFVVDKETDAQVQATYYRANNYNAALAAATDPYGAGGRDYSITVGLKHKFTAKMVGTAKVGYLQSKNETAGGNSDYHGPVAYLALEHQF
ncbi:MAG: hypothetical protein NTV51_21800 [Verrucomicrobia bacterium]|nr:hypothetical protein [Verrucomicrobiota bacterium]